MGLIVLSYVFWLIESFILFLLYFLFVWEGFYFSRLFEDTRLLLITFASIIVFIVVLFSGIPGRGFILFLCILLVPYLLSSIEREEQLYRTGRIDEDNAEIESLKERLDRGGDEPGILLRLGYLYKDTENYEEALKYLQKAKDIMGDEVLLGTEREIKQLEEKVKEEKDKKKGVCPHCGASMSSGQVLCRECYSFSGKQVRKYFKSVFRKSAEASPPIILLIILFIFSVIMFALFLDFFHNFIFYVLLAGNIIMIVKKSVQERIK